ncbi:MAG: hypothetical protein IJU27_01930 [Bacteroidales bacterium]|nr:hypothetical protein [Bacteroidales bacterium]
MKQNDTLKQNLIRAFKQSNHKVEITEPNNLELCQKYDGTPFLLIHGDTIKFSVWYGNCIVMVLGHTFICDFDNGEWSAEKAEDSWLLEDSEFVEAMRSAKGVISGEQRDIDAQTMVFARANHLNKEIPACLGDLNEMPKLLGNLDLYDPVQGIVSITLKRGEKKDVECDLYCSSIYQLYCKLKSAGKLYKSPTVSSNYIEKELPELHREILHELQSNGYLSDVSNLVRYSLINRKAFFESILG